MESELETGNRFRLFICESFIKSGVVNKENAYLTAMEMFNADQFPGIKHTCSKGLIIEEHSVRFDGGGMFSIDAKCKEGDSNSAE